ncbi:MAG: Crp/Fnr family transcriptional regulator [Actinomycetota bacterium]|nr:Crp/Fnr family transcriptional regulator [Actinomycetota bacterium]
MATVTHPPPDPQPDHHEDLFGKRLVRSPRPQTVRVFAHEPDLLTGLDGHTANVLRRRVTVRTRYLQAGAWVPPDDLGPGALGLLVLDGLLIRCVELDGRECPELVGAGDLVRPWDQADELFSLPHTTSWRVLRPAWLAVLDSAFANVVARFPTILGALLSRSTARARTLSLTLAIAHVRHAETRLLMLLWHLADRWGRMTPDGVLVTLPLTHELLAHLTCMRRPTASTALGQLTRAGQLARHSDGSWLLTGSPPQPPTRPATAVMPLP